MKNKKNNKKRNIINFRTKAEVILIVALFIGIAVSSVWGTVTMTDKTTTTTDSGLIINFEEGWINIWNTTIDNESVDRDRMLGWDASNVTLIRNSNGNSWTVSAANLQIAIYDLNSTNGGYVELPQCNITITETIHIPDNVWLRGIGNKSILYLGDDANCTMIENQNHIVKVGGTYVDNGDNTNIIITDLVLRGNQYNQPKWASGTNSLVRKDMIRFSNVNDSYIENVQGYNALNIFIHLADCENIFVNNVYGYGMGMNWSTGLCCGITEHVTAGGMWIGASYNVTVTNSNFAHYWATGIIVENEWVINSPNYQAWSENVIIDSCMFMDGFTGVWIEEGTDVVISNSIFKNLRRVEDIYIVSDMEPTGIVAGSDSNNITITGCLFNNIGNSTSNEGQAMIIAGLNTTVSNNVIRTIYGNGSKVVSPSAIFNGNSIHDCAWNGIYAGFNSVFGPSQTIITNNVIKNVGKAGIQIKHMGGVGSDTLGTIISGNLIADCADATNTYTYSGIFSQNVDNLTITDNSINNFYCGIYITGDYCIINDNHISDSVGVGTYGAGIFLYGHNNSINDNHISDCLDRGIMFYGNDSTVCSNRITGSGDRGISIGYGATHTENCTLMGNALIGFTLGIYESTTICDNNMFIGNNANRCTNGYDINSDNYKPTGQTNFTNFNFGTWT